MSEPYLIGTKTGTLDRNIDNNHTIDKGIRYRIEYSPCHLDRNPKGNPTGGTLGLESRLTTNRKVWSKTRNPNIARVIDNML